MARNQVTEFIQLLEYYVGKKLLRNKFPSDASFDEIFLTVYKYRNTVIVLPKQWHIYAKLQKYLRYETNHSFRGTNATWLFDSDVDEQIIMERTGHLSTEGVRSHKWTSKVQHEKLSDILNCTKSCVCRKNMFHTAANQTPSSNNRYRVLTYLETSAFTTMIL